jgi:hypothetical protein
VSSGLFREFPTEGKQVERCGDAGLRYLNDLVKMWRSGRRGPINVPKKWYALVDASKVVVKMGRSGQRSQVVAGVVKEQ